MSDLDKLKDAVDAARNSRALKDRDWFAEQSILFKDRAERAEAQCAALREALLFNIQAVEDLQSGKPATWFSRDCHALSTDAGGALLKELKALRELRATCEARRECFLRGGPGLLNADRREFDALDALARLDSK